jgi:hypothetical protein
MYSLYGRSGPFYKGLRAVPLASPTPARISGGPLCTLWLCCSWRPRSAVSKQAPPLLRLRRERRNAYALRVRGVRACVRAWRVCVAACVAACVRAWACARPGAWAGGGAGRRVRMSLAISLQKFSPTSSQLRLTHIVEVVLPKAQVSLPFRAVQETSAPPECGQPFWVGVLFRGGFSHAVEYTLSVSRSQHSVLSTPGSRAQRVSRSAR